MHTMAEEATAAYEESRAKVARLIKSPTGAKRSSSRATRPSRSTSSPTPGAGQVLKPGRRDRADRDGAPQQHHAVAAHRAERRGAKIRYVDIDDDGRLRCDDELEAFIGPKTKIVAMVQMSNVLGTINPVREIAEMAHRFGAIMLVDGAQSVPHMPVDVRRPRLRLPRVLGHKMLGPDRHRCALGTPRDARSDGPVPRRRRDDPRVTLEGSTWNDIPYKFEAGTPNIADVIAFGAAIDYLEGLGMDSVREHEIAITQYAIEALQRVDGVTVYGPPSAEERAASVTFNYGDLHPHDLSQVLDQQASRSAPATTARSR